MIIEKITQSRISDVDFNELPFGSFFSDHMLVADFENGQWQEPKIIPFQRLPFSPSLSAINYGQAIFEGMKAYYGSDGNILLFRPMDNFKRMNTSAERMCMPEIPEEIFMNGLKELLKVDRAWVPKTDGASLYIRPVLFATDEAIGVKPSETYKFCIVTCPVQSFFKDPLKVYVETHYTRASEGGFGYAKAAGNYGGAMYPTKLAQKNGFHQVIWTDATEHKYLEESGAMNLMVVIGDTLITPKLTESKLAGITRDSVLKVAKHWNVKTEERNISINEIIDAFNNQTLKELFGCGTAANIAPIKMFGYAGKEYPMPVSNDEFFSVKVARYLSNIKQGKTEDIFGWIVNV